MKSRRVILGITFLVCFSVTTTAQQQSTLYFMNLPQNHLLNPALKSSADIYIGIPVLSGIYGNFNTNFIGLSDIVEKNDAGKLISVFSEDFDKDKFLSKVKELNYITPGMTIQTLGVGFTIKNDLQFYLDINDKLDGKLVVPYDLFDLAFNSTDDFIGKTVNLSDTDIDLIYYREIGAGFSKNISPRLRIGARAKLIMGMAAVNLDVRDLSVEVLPDGAREMVTDITLNISGPVTITRNSDNTIDDIDFNDNAFSGTSFFLNTDNLGFGIDVGATYLLFPKITISAALNGFGFINWKSDLTNVTAKNEFTYTGFDIDAVIAGTVKLEDMAQDLIDSLTNSFVITDVREPFKSVLPGTLTVAGSYNLNELISFGLVSSTLFVNGSPRTSLMLSANANLIKGFSAGLSYTASNRSYSNFGIGLAARLGPVQLYTIADKIPVNFSRLATSEESTNKILLPDNWNVLSFRVGINLVFGSNPRKKSDKPMVITSDNR